jgi:TRAP-type C4-dicarboxylate transport system permease small subunit
MAKLTMVFGGLLIVVSLGFWIAMGRAESAALHPAGLGVLLVLFGALANTENPKRRMLWMHLAVTVGVLGFLITGVNATVQIAKGTVAEGNPLKFDERVAAALICLVFVGLCVRSFIAARRLRAA